VYLPLVLGRSDSSPLRVAQAWSRAAGAVFTDFSLICPAAPADVWAVRIRLTASTLLAALLLTSVAAPAMATANSTYRHRLYLAMNEVRVAHHLRPLHISNGLRTAAQRHSSDMIARGYFGHTSPAGSTLYDRIVHSGFQRFGQWWAGENLAWGTGTVGSPRYTVKMWLASPEHRAILLSSRFGLVGIGRATGRFEGYSGAVVWTVDFGHR
jgi:uncharacterized protein YkwD